MGTCDLHTHSTFSDGTLTPTELISAARDAGLQAIALTDHDTLAGLDEARQAGKRFGVRVLRGVEVSVEMGGATVHILGYCFRPDAQELPRRLGEIAAARDARNRLILAKLAELGCPVTAQELAAEAGEGVVGRPHIAAILIRKGFVADKDEAFAKYLARGCPAYVERLRFDPEEAISLIRGAGGVAVLAHPYLVKMSEGQDLDALVARLAAAGLGGMECIYTRHTPDQTDEYRAIAARHGLLVTGGSDFHGANSPDVMLGAGFGGLSIPVQCADLLEARATGQA